MSIILVAAIAFIAFNASNDLSRKVNRMPSKQLLGDPSRHSISDADPNEVEQLYREFRRSHAKLVGTDGSSRNLPNSLHGFLAQIITHLFKGQSVSIVKDDAQATTAQAALMLGVSRQFLINLLEKDRAIPFHKVGNHRRVYVKDILSYKARRDAGRRHLLDTLAREEAAQGTYTATPLPDDPAG
jgi:excisionase family DNA binding protein